MEGFFLLLFFLQRLLFIIAERWNNMAVGKGGCRISEVDASRLLNLKPPMRACLFARDNFPESHAAKSFEE